MVEDVAVVVDSKGVTVHTQLQNRVRSGQASSQVRSGQVRHTLYGGMSFSISAMGTSVPATPRSSAMRTWREKSVRINCGEGGGGETRTILMRGDRLS